MRKTKKIFPNVFAPQLAAVASFMASYMEYQDRVGR